MYYKFLLFVLFSLPMDSYPETASALSEEELLKNPAIIQAKKACQTHYEKEANYRLGGKDYETPGDCIWGELSPEFREALLKVEDANKVLSPTVEESIKLPLTEMEKKAMVPFRKYLKEKLAQAIQSSFNNENETFIDIHSIYELYEQRVGKSIIETVSSFCLDANMESQTLTISKNKEARTKQRKDNLSLLNTVSTEGVVSAYEPWTRCIVGIAPLCHKNDGQRNYTHRRACEVTNYIHAAKQGLTASREIKKALGTFHSKHSVHLDVNIYTGARGRLTSTRPPHSHQKMCPRPTPRKR